MYTLSFQETIDQGNSELVQAHIRSNYSLLNTEIDGVSPLEYAVRSGRLASVETLYNEAVRYGARNDVRLAYREANKLSDEAMKDFLIEKQSFLELINTGDVNLLLDYIARYPEAVNAYIQEQPPIVHAVRSGNLAVVSALIAEHAEIDAIGISRLTAYGEAYRLNNAAMQDLLREHGSQCNLRELPIVEQFQHHYGGAGAGQLLISGSLQIGKIELHGYRSDPNAATFVVEPSHSVRGFSVAGSSYAGTGMEVLSALAHSHSNPQGMGLYSVIASGNVAELTRRIEENDDVATDFIEGKPPLCWAIQFGYTEMMRVLLQNGADVDRPGSEGSPFMTAIQSHNIEAIRILKQYGADLSEFETASAFLDSSTHVEVLNILFPDEDMPALEQIATGINAGADDGLPRGSELDFESIASEVGTVSLAGQQSDSKDDCVGGE